MVIFDELYDKLYHILSLQIWLHDLFFIASFKVQETNKSFFDQLEHCQGVIDWFEIDHDDTASEVFAFSCKVHGSSCKSWLANTVQTNQRNDTLVLFHQSIKQFRHLNISKLELVDLLVDKLELIVLC